MTNIVAVGAQWGDEGKGKFVDWLAARTSIVARFQGGPNAGHTLVVGDERIVLHHVPSGILHEDVHCVIGSGCVVSPLRLAEELRELDRVGVDWQARLLISERCHLIFPYHEALDRAREARAKGDKIGTTCRGIGPAYEDKAARRGVRFCDLASPEGIARVWENWRFANFLLEHWFQAQPVPRESVEEALEVARGWLSRFVGDAGAWLRARMRRGASVLFEGAQGALLDLDHGTYPFVTSSNTVAAAAAIGTGVGPLAIHEAVGICKAYTTRVGAGPFPTELYDGERLLDPIGRHLAERGQEFGSTTGRPRRTGWFDAVVVRYAVEVGGLTALALTKLDVLDGLAEIKICTAYELDGKQLLLPPADPAALARCRPVYETLAGWDTATAGVHDAAQLPPAARAFLQRVGELVGAPVRWVSTGPEREEVLRLR